MVKSMTEGNPLKLILNFTIPLLLGNLFQQTYNMVDAIIVGRYIGANALASVGASSSVQFMVLGFCMGCCAGFTIPVAQQFGAKNYDRMRSYIFHSGVLCVILAIIMTSVCAILCPQILHLMKTPDKLYADAYNYFLIIVLGIPFSLLYNILAGILRAVGDSRTPFIFLAVSTVSNILLDLLFIIVFKWGCAGAAGATITSQAVSGMLCLILINKKFDILKLKRSDMKLNGKNMLTCITMGIPMGLQYSITAIGSMVLQASNNKLGEVYISAFAAGSKIKQFAMCPFDALATAVSSFCSQNLGAKQPDRIRKGLRQAVTIGVAYGALIGLVLIFGGRTLTRIFVNKSAVDVLDASAKYLRYLGFFFWSLGILNVARMVTQGLGYSGRAVFSGVTEMIARTVVCLGFVGTFGFTAICFADQTAWITATCYIFPTCLWCIRKSTKMLASIAVRVNNAS